MSNRILSVTLRDHSLIPAEAVVHVTVVPQRLDAGTEVRGRLMGPRCRFASTVEVAYHLRPLPVPTGQPALTLRAIIPEASFWEPNSPHLYAGPIELWQDGQRCEVVQVRRGLRHLTLGPHGLRLNGKPLQLSGREVAMLDDESALALRESGYNLVVAGVDESTKAIWEIADRIGLFVLGRIQGETAVTHELAGHPSCLGWITGESGVIQGEAPGSSAGQFAVRDGLLLDASANHEGEASLGVVEF
jgi:hypothetical protein